MKFVEQTKYMSSPVSTVVTRFAYGLSQLPRVAWYLGHGLALRRLAEAARRREGSQSRTRRRPHTDSRVPDRDYIYPEMIRLFYAGPRQCGGRHLPCSCRSRWISLNVDPSLLFFEDLPKVHLRRQHRAYNEVLNKETR